jgi:hypothetical protein
MEAAVPNFPKSVARDGNALLLAGLIAFSLPQLGLPDAALADQFLPARGGWQTYVNDRYGTRLDFPAYLFTPGEPREHGDGLRFTSEDAALEVYAFQNADNESARALKARLIGAEGYTDVTYSPSGDNWLVLSGFRESTIFYEKYLFRGAVVHAFGMEFPAAAKPRYAPIVERIEDSFRASD